MGFLEDDHRCPRGVFSRLGESLFTVAIGGGIGTALCYGLQEYPPLALVLAAAALGAVLAMAVRQATSGRV
jgi:hypothetical protein